MPQTKSKERDARGGPGATEAEEDGARAVNGPAVEAGPGTGRSAATLGATGAHGAEGEKCPRKREAEEKRRRETARSALGEKRVTEIDRVTVKKSLPHGSQTGSG